MQMLLHINLHKHSYKFKLGKYFIDMTGTISTAKTEEGKPVRGRYDSAARLNVHHFTCHGKWRYTE